MTPDISKRIVTLKQTQALAACALLHLTVQIPHRGSTPEIIAQRADSIPVLTMPIVRRLAAAQRAIDSLAKTSPLASSQIPAQDLPRSVAGQMTLRIAELNRSPAFIAAVRRSGFPTVAAYAYASAWLTTAWSVIIAERASGQNPAATDSAQPPVPGMPPELLAFVRTHEPEFAALGFSPPSPFVPTDVALHDYFTRPPYVRQFFDSSAHTIRIVTTSVSDYLQGFLDSADGTAAGAQHHPPLRVLFLGNSLTYYHAMPRLFAQLAAVGLHRRIVTGLVSLPGSSLPELWAGTDLAQVVTQLPWDVVVIQVHPSADPALTNDIARRVSAPIIAHGGRAVVWGQYAGPGEDASVQAPLDTIFAATAQAIHADVAPVPAVWDAVRRADTVTWKRLFDDLPHGDTHPSPSGSYLLALTFYRTITGQSPTALPRTVGDSAILPSDARRLQHILY